MNKCKANRKDGCPCEAQAQPESDYCLFHNPERKAELKAARRQGGQTRAEQLSGATLVKMQTAEQVRDYLEQLAADTQAQLVPAKTATAIANIARVQLQAIEAANKSRWDLLS